MSPARTDLETRLRWLSISVVGLFSVAFTVGLIFYLLEPGGRVAVAAVNTGLVLLIASPAVRMAVATAERIRRRDWTFLGMMLVIALEIAVVLSRAYAKA